MKPDEKSSAAAAALELSAKKEGGPKRDWHEVQRPPGMEET